MLAHRSRFPMLRMLSSCAHQCHAVHVPYIYRIYHCWALRFIRFIPSVVLRARPSFPFNYITVLNLVVLRYPPVLTYVHDTYIYIYIYHIYFVAPSVRLFVGRRNNRGAASSPHADSTACMLVRTYADEPHYILASKIDMRFVNR